MFKLLLAWLKVWLACALVASLITLFPFPISLPLPLPLSLSLSLCFIRRHSPISLNSWSISNGSLCVLWTTVCF